MSDDAHEQKPKFANENAKAQSNLREKNKTFSFQLGDCTDSDDDVLDQQPLQDIRDTSAQRQQDEDKQESVNIERAMLVAQQASSAADSTGTPEQPRAGGKGHKNPFAMRLFQRSQELSASQLSQMRRNQMKLQKQQKGLQQQQQTKAAAEVKSLAITTSDKAPSDESAKATITLNEAGVAPPAAISQNKQNSNNKGNATKSTNVVKLKRKFNLQIDEEDTQNNTYGRGPNDGVGLALDIDEINKLYTAGGEQGKKKDEKKSEIEEFESDIRELATKCLAAICREKPTDPIIYGDAVKKFGVKMDQENSELFNLDNQADPLKQQQNYFRPNFNVPQTMRGIKGLSLGIGQKKAPRKPLAVDKGIDGQGKDGFEIDPLMEESDDDKDDDFFVVPSNVKQMSIRQSEAETPSNLKNFEAEITLQSPIISKAAPQLNFLQTEIDEVLDARHNDIDALMDGQQVSDEIDSPNPVKALQEEFEQQQREEKAKSEQEVLDELKKLESNIFLPLDDDNPEQNEDHQMKDAEEGTDLNMELPTLDIEPQDINKHESEAQEQHKNLQNIEKSNEKETVEQFDTQQDKVLHLSENDIDFLNVINDGLSAKEFADVIMQLKTAASQQEEGEDWKAMSIVKTDENCYTLESKDGTEFKIAAKSQKSPTMMHVPDIAKKTMLQPLTIETSTQSEEDKKE